MLGLILSLFGFLLGIALLWSVLLWAFRFRKKAPGPVVIVSSGVEEPMSAEQLVESWTKSP